MLPGTPHSAFESKLHRRYQNENSGESLKIESITGVFKMGATVITNSQNEKGGKNS